MTKPTVVISQHQGKNPAKWQLEEELVTALLSDGNVAVALVPHLYDLSATHSATEFLRSITGDLIVLSWLYPRSSRWILDRQNVRGHEGVTRLESQSSDDDEEEQTRITRAEAARPESEVLRLRNGIPNRRIYCLDLRDHPDAKPYLDEIRRIVAEDVGQVFNLPVLEVSGDSESQKARQANSLTDRLAPQLEKYLRPLEILAEQKSAKTLDEDDDAPVNGEVVRRRWYPVIDYSRCTNCMECIDFCLFGVYGLDAQGLILVEQQDNCKKGCPACSRVCPANAIVFPGHKTPAIAGADGEVGDVKIDLSKLFGAPSAVELAARERDVELVRDGRDAVGLSIGIPKRLKDKPKKPRDELDDLIDSLDALEL